MPEGWQHFPKVIVVKLEKDGSDVSEYEDAAAVKRVETGWRIAIADGASDAVFAGAWARMLVRRFVRRPFLTTAGLAYPVRRLGRQWRRTYAQLELPWNVLRKLEQGAAATMVGLVISLPHGRGAAGLWRAMSIGDACLFHVRGATLLQMLPELAADDFGNSPALIYTDVAGIRRLAQGHVATKGEWQKGDIFVLASDALARWIRLRLGGGQGEWRDLLAHADRPDRAFAFRNWAREEQACRRLKNDDLTMVLCMT